MVVDYRKENFKILFDSYPMPIIEESLAQVEMLRFFQCSI